jgi:hypothetical protein
MDVTGAKNAANTNKASLFLATHGSTSTNLGMSIFRF